MSENILHIILFTMNSVAIAAGNINITVLLVFQYLLFIISHNSL